MIRTSSRVGASLLTVAVLTAGIALSNGALAENGVAPAAATPVTATMVAARQAKHDPALNFLTYQHMDEIFGTQPVISAAPTPLPSGTAWSDDQFDIQMDERTYTIDEALERMRFSSLVVMRDGEMVYEKYRNGTDVDTKSIIYSASKSVTAILIGIAVEKGIIDSIDDPVDKYLPQLSETGYAGVPIKHLMTMQAGNSWRENYAEGSALYIHRNRALNLQEIHFEDFALTMTKETESGTKFNYSTLDTCIVGWLLDEAVDGKLSEFMSENLWTPAGMESDAYWVEGGLVSDPRPFYGAGLVTTTRDLARLGQLMLNGGTINGNRIVSEEWVKEMSTPKGGMSHYGYYWWMQPDGAYAALGVAGQGVYVNPNTNTVIAFNGHWPVLVADDWNAARDELIASINAM